MRLFLWFMFALISGCTSSIAGTSEGAEPGAAAPGFSLQDLDGQTVTLDAHRGKTVVLEWFNPDCPFVKVAHEANGALQTMAADRSSEVIWLAINSNAKGKNGYGVKRNREAADTWSMAHPILMDADGTTGRAYGARTTPHMYVVDPAGVLVYAGALDNAPMGRHEGAYVNHVARALEDLAAGRPVKTPQTKPYGCSVKY